MTAADIRKMFVEEHGRFDLVGDYPTCEVDTGADRYLNRAQYLLDRMVTPHGRKERRFFTISAATSSITLERAVRVENVFYVTGDNAVVALEYQPDFTCLIKNVEGISDPGVPLYWGLNVSVTDEADLSSFEGKKGVGESFTKKVLLFYPSAEEEMTLQVVGRFLSEALSETPDGSFWTQDHNVAALLGAARYYLMQSLAAGTGTREAMEALLMEVRMLQFDQVEIENQDYRDYIL